MNIIIGFSGRAGSGKDTAASYLHSVLIQNDRLAKIDSFAAPLKRACCEIFSWPKGVYDNREYKEAVDKYWGFSPRTAAQQMGTEAMRTTFGNDIWIRALERRLPLHDLPQHIFTIITDVRFQNEANWVLSNGGFLIDIERHSGDDIAGENKAHASEQGYVVDPPSDRHVRITNNGTLDELASKMSLLAGYVAGVASVTFSSKD